MTNHTPTPWTLSEIDDTCIEWRDEENYGNEIATVNLDTAIKGSDGNAAFIVRAVNAHEALLSMLAFVKQSIKPNMGYEDVISLQGQIAQAIAKASGKPV